MAAILDFFKVTPRLKSIIRFQGIVISKMAVLSTWQQFHLASHTFFKCMAAILDFFKVAPRLILKVRSQGIIMPKMVLVSTVVTNGPISVAKPPH